MVVLSSPSQSRCASSGRISCVDCQYIGLSGIAMSVGLGERAATVGTHVGLRANDANLRQRSSLGQLKHAFHACISGGSTYVARDQDLVAVE